MNKEEFIKDLLDNYSRKELNEMADLGNPNVAKMKKKEDVALLLANQSPLNFDENGNIPEEKGEENAPPLELTEKLKEDILEDQDEKLKQAAADLSKTVNDSNGVNLWRLIARVFNPVTGYEHKTLAMKISTRGVLMCITEKVSGTATSTATYIDNGKLVKEEDNWIVK